MLRDGAKDLDVDQRESETTQKVKRGFLVFPEQTNMQSLIDTFQVDDLIDDPADIYDRYMHRRQT